MEERLEKRIRSIRMNHIGIPNEPSCLFCVEASHGNYDVSGHAISRYMQRRRPERRFDTYHLVEQFRNLVIKGFPVARKNSAFAIIKNEFKPANYLWSNGWVFVVENGIIKTVYDKGGKLRNSTQYRRVKSP